MKYLLAAFALFLPFTAFAQHNHPGKEKEVVTLVAGLGDVDHPVSTSNPVAQKFFNQGLAYIYGFNHEEAMLSFKKAAELDPQMTMAYWGAALSLGSNYNLQADSPQLQEAFANLERARASIAKASDHDRAYVEALSKRYSNDPSADRQKLAVAYSAAMRELMKNYPDDLDAATLYAESLMNLRPWKLWSLDGKPAEDTVEIISVLEGVLRRNPNHTGANHYYIHAVEASPSAERGLASAARLGKLAPKAGHLVHMPSHIYIRTGDYNEAAVANADAIVADREYIAQRGVDRVYPMMYYNHNIHFLASANAMKGRFADAMKSARELEASVAPHVKQMPMLEMFMPYTTVTLVRFRRWDDLLKTTKPPAELKITTAMWHFGRGMAYAGTKQLEQSEAEFNMMKTISKTVAADAPWGNNVAADVLNVAEQTLGGYLALAKGDKTAAIDLLTRAVELEDKTAYNEPADWDFPVREILGAAFLQLRDDSNAERVFRSELTKHPRNGRALFGLIESLKRQNKTSSSQMVQKEFEKAWQAADVKLTVEHLTGFSSSQ